MDNLEYIENFFSRAPGLTESREFETRIGSDPDFAEEVATYLIMLRATREESNEEKKNRFKEIYRKNPVHARVPVRKLVYYIAAAAAIVGILFGIYIFAKPVSPQKLAAAYIKEDLQTLGVTMGSKKDALQDGLALYNQGKISEALSQFEQIIQSDTSNFTAKEYAGLASLRLKDYDRALRWFENLEQYKNLHANPALLYQSLTLMERNQSGDEKKAKHILQQIVQDDQEGKETAREWLRKLE